MLQKRVITSIFIIFAGLFCICTIDFILNFNLTLCMNDIKRLRFYNVDRLFFFLIFRPDYSLLFYIINYNLCY